MKRREFCILTTAAGVGALCGWLLPISKPDVFQQQNFPMLRGDIQFSTGELRFKGNVIGNLDALAAEVLQHLDGKHSIPEIANKLQSRHAVSPANIACFCLILQEANLLTAPINVRVYNQEYQT